MSIFIININMTGSILDCVLYSRGGKNKKIYIPSFHEGYVFIGAARLHNWANNYETQRQGLLKKNTVCHLSWEAEIKGQRR